MLSHSFVLHNGVKEKKRGRRKKGEKMKSRGSGTQISEPSCIVPVSCFWLNGGRIQGLGDLAVNGRHGHTLPPWRERGCD